MELSSFQISEKHEVSLTLRLDGQQWQNWLQKASRELQARSAVPGYRPGKAPVAAAYRCYGRSLLERASQLALPETLDIICAQKDLAPVTQPLFTMVEPDLEQLTACCDFVTYPQITELSWRGLQVKKYIKTCKDADVDDALRRYMLQRLDVHPVDREAKMDDIVEVSFHGTHKGGPFYYDHSDNSRFRLGSGQLFAGLDEVLVGHHAGEDLHISLTMPEDFHREEVRGLTLDLDVRLLGVWARDLRECNDAFVKEFVKGCETVEQFREQLRDQVQTRFDRDAERIYQQDLDKAIADTVTVPMPEAMIRVAVDGMIRALQPAAAQRNMTVPQLLASEGRTVESYVEQCRPIAEDKVRRSVALDYVIRSEKLAISEEDYRRYIRLSSGDKPYAETERRLGGKEEIVMQMLNSRARDLVAASVQVVPVQVDEFPGGGKVD